MTSVDKDSIQNLNKKKATIFALKGYSCINCLRLICASLNSPNDILSKANSEKYIKNEFLHCRLYVNKINRLTSLSVLIDDRPCIQYWNESWLTERIE